MTSRIGIIGLGTIGKTHWRVTRESPETTLIAVADPAPSALDFARAASIPAYADYREMLENETLDGVIVAVPNAEHVPVALACIERVLPAQKVMWEAAGPGVQGYRANFHCLHSGNKL